MTTLRLLLLAGILAVAGWWLWTTLDRPPLADPLWEVEATAPILVGTPGDPFAYTGGDAIRTTEGAARIQQTTKDALVSLHAEVLFPEAVGAALPGSDEPLVGAWGLRFLRDPDIGEAQAIWREVGIHGDTGRGDPRLPETHARIAGTAWLSVYDGSASQLQPLPVIWSVAHAIRQTDGAIRQQGLTFSPLLRDKQGFSDPNRWELTLLVYDDPAGEGPANGDPANAAAGERPVLLQIVYRDVTDLPDALLDQLPD